MALGYFMSFWKNKWDTGLLSLDLFSYPIYPTGPIERGCHKNISLIPQFLQENDYMLWTSRQTQWHLMWNFSQNF